MDSVLECRFAGTEAVILLDLVADAQKFVCYVIHWKPQTLDYVAFVLAE